MKWIVKLENDTRVWTFLNFGLFKAFCKLNAGRIESITDHTGKVYERVATDMYMKTHEIMP